MSLVLTDVAVRQQVLLERFKSSQIRRFSPIITALDKRIREALSGPALTGFRRARLETQLGSIRAALRGEYGEYVTGLTAELRALGTDMAVFEAGVIKAYAPGARSIATPAPNQVWAAATTNPLTMLGTNGAPMLQTFMDRWADGDADMVTNAVRQGYLLGETNDQIVRRIRGSAELRYSDGVLATSRSHAETVTRTAIQHVANTARAETWAANSDIVEEYQWVSTLDSRTTPMCRELDGERFPVGKGPLPPGHPNCRSTTVAVIGGEFGRLLEEDSTRASVDGPVPANETYYDWLGRQDPEFQDIALGPTRGQLFRDGGLSADQFSKLQLGKNFEPMTLEEMRKIAPKAFRRAGL